MNTKFTRMLAAATMTAVALAASACGSDDDGLKVEEETLTLTKQETDLFKYVDVEPKTKLGEQGPEELSLGDQIISGGEYVDAAGKHNGDLDIICAITKPGGLDKASQQCTATITLRDGTLSVLLGGPIMQETGMTVVGGTGRYEGATGSATTKPGAKGRSTDVMHLYLPKKS